MANPEHLAMLNKGVEAWNEWRQTHPLTIPELVGGDLTSLKLSGKSLRIRPNLIGANLRVAGLRGADLTGADLRWSDLRQADLRDANLTETLLPMVNFDGAHLSGANFSSAFLEGTTFGNVDLSNVKGLERVQHWGPSTIGIDTIYKSKGKIPEVFLRGAGVPDGFLESLRSLTDKDRELHSCFISYSTKDQDFADKLYKSLQVQRVRCFLATEDLKIGDPFRDIIDRSIKQHDKLLLILSEHSVQSAWVRDEVEAALERERQDDCLVLFPIRIDDAVMDTDKAWAASIRRTRHIGDFTRWKEHDAYQRAFERLLRDLKDESKAKDKEAGR
jgi:TIR domain-containing protein/pentapeptide repeat protein